MSLIYYERDFRIMSKCTVHSNFFDDNCAECKREYSDLKGLHDIYQQSTQTKKEERGSSYKAFTEDRAKKLYEELILQYVTKDIGELEAAERARSIIRKQCRIRGIETWPWVE